MVSTYRGRRGAVCALLAVMSFNTHCSTRSAAPRPELAPERARPSPSEATLLPLPVPAMPRERQKLFTEAGSPLELYPPLSSSPQAPLVVMLHGMCMEPLDVCDFWNAAGREQGFLVCPAGNVTCGGAFDWQGPTEDRIAAVDQALEAVDQAYLPLIDHHRGDILIGYSRGGYLARDLLYARPGLFRGVIFVGAAVNPDPSRLLESGVERAVFASGDYDGARASMQRSARDLSARGIPARFVSLGPIGHALPANLEHILRDALAWLRDEA